jgi:hypothetical protein
MEGIAFLFVLLYPHNKTAEFDWRRQHGEPKLKTSVKRLKIKFQKVKQPFFFGVG